MLMSRCLFVVPALSLTAAAAPEHQKKADVNDFTSNVLSFVNSITADTGGIGTEVASDALSFASGITSAVGSLVTFATSFDGEGITVIGTGSDIVTVTGGVAVSVGPNGISVGHAATTGPSEATSGSASTGTTSSSAASTLAPWTLTIPLLGSISTIVAGIAVGALAV